MIRELKSLLTSGKGHSLALYTMAGEVLCFDGRGVSDLYRLYVETPELLRGAVVADRVTGVGAAALMALGGVAEYYTRVISREALKLLEEHSIKGTFDLETEQIINRAGTGRCPLETLLAGIPTPGEMLPVIHRFMAGMNAGKPRQ